MAEEQSRHRQHLEKRTIEANIQAQKRGQVFGFLVGAAGVLGGFYLVSIGKDGYGIAAVLGSIASLVGVYIYGKERTERERAQKRQELLGSQ